MIGLEPIREIIKSLSLSESGGLPVTLHLIIIQLSNIWLGRIDSNDHRVFQLTDSKSVGLPITLLPKTFTAKNTKPRSPFGSGVWKSFGNFIFLPLPVTSSRMITRSSPCWVGGCLRRCLIKLKHFALLSIYTRHLGVCQLLLQKTLKNLLNCSTMLFLHSENSKNWH